MFKILAQIPCEHPRLIKLFDVSFPLLQKQIVHDLFDIYYGFASAALGGEERIKSQVETEMEDAP